MPLNVEQRQQAAARRMIHGSMRSVPRNCEPRADLSRLPAGQPRQPASALDA